MMAQTFKVFSALLSYPTAEVQAAVPEMRRVIKEEGVIPADHQAPVTALLDEFAERDLYDLEERYVLLFDRTRSLSLHLFEHVHGESRDRGQAMVDLSCLYEQHGLVLDGSELPDYIPIFLEFLSTRPVAEAKSLLGQPLHILTVLGERLAKRESAYAAVFQALSAVAEGQPDPEIVTALRQEPDDDPEDLETLDAVWEDEEVTFSPTGSDGGSRTCPRAGEILSRIMKSPASGDAGRVGNE